MGDRYDDMTGPVLAEELGKRELPVTGRVDELRTRLREDDEKRAQPPADGPDPGTEGEETEADDVEAPEPREPRDYIPMAVVLSEAQARRLTAGEAKLKAFTKHVTHMSARKYCAGDRVTGIADWDNDVCVVLPFGVEIALEHDDQDQDGLERLREADEKLKD